MSRSARRRCSVSMRSRYASCAASRARRCAPSRPNFPPDAWLDREGWTLPVIVDTDDSIAATYGLTAYPFWVFVGADGTVIRRAAGEMSITDLEATLGSLVAG